MMVFQRSALSAPIFSNALMLQRDNMRDLIKLKLSNYFALALFFISITDKIEWWGTLYILPFADELLRYLEGNTLVQRSMIRKR